MKVYITNYTDKKIYTNKEQPIYVHYFSDCNRLNANYSENEMFIRNSGVQEIDLGKKEELFSTLVKLNKLKICNECKQRDLLMLHNESPINENESTKIISAKPSLMNEESTVLTEAKHAAIASILRMKFSEYQAKLTNKLFRV